MPAKGQRWPPARCSLPSDTHIISVGVLELIRVLLVSLVKVGEPPLALCDHCLFLSRPSCCLLAFAALFGTSSSAGRPTTSALAGHRSPGFKEQACKPAIFVLDHTCTCRYTFEKPHKHSRLQSGAGSSYALSNYRMAKDSYHVLPARLLLPLRPFVPVAVASCLT